MAFSKFNMDKLFIRKLADRKNKVNIEKDHVSIAAEPEHLPHREMNLIIRCADKIKLARGNKKPVILAFGAHTIKNGMAPVLKTLINEGWITHLATNGAGIIHDWEFAFQGKSSEDVKKNVKLGQFGIWDETGFYINLAINIGAYEGLGYGESVGRMIFREGLDIPSLSSLYDLVREKSESNSEIAASAADLAGVIKKFDLNPGFLSIPHPFKKYSVQSAAYELGVNFTGHPMIGYDIIYTHPMNHGAAIGRTAIRDFLSFAGSISNLDKGVYLSVGSAVMSPMIFEKSLSMAQNIAIQNNKSIDNYFIMVVDLAKIAWDWQKDGEPPYDNPAYYLRFCKTFSRMGGEMHYINADNRDFLLMLYRQLAAK